MIILDENVRCLVQGITGRQGSFHTKQMLEYGTKIVAGVTPGKGGKKVAGVDVYNSIEEAKEHVDVNASIIFVPSQFAKDAAFEAIKHLDLVVIITEHMVSHDTMEIIEYANRMNTIVIGPNTPGIITPGVGKLGIMPHHIFREGNVGIVSRSGTLMYEFASKITEAGFGQSTCLGIGGDLITGLDFVDVLRMFEKDPDTDVVLLIGEIGGDAEERAAKYINKMSKPVIAFIAGFTAPPGKRMGHAGAIIEGGKGTAESKINALKDAGAYVVKKPSEVVDIIREM
ncbi:succinyl-CoA synthetase (ADP-forming) alpha subunit [Methanothermus fervidus DSM 2088]|uniref:Succinate--CoA ligase [ADP-forming] subunit alpha n=1 Tax=Methanothermus fervidus (strain ATCC 43054 / DSM 2088 / JCM 10308 / V24 S) TaxID=523846 RepID=E3GWK2_METFV|nr:succinate--CoA ligase subunit alpha [Methanothermus fervidus]ADP76816.1 succinyl-CoA synthetase (ADP-forming) alpha subunit [Methanothermus fervidus DSM 2088]